MSESEKLLKQYTSDLKTANAAFSLAQEETEKEYWKKVIESLKEEYKDKSTKKEREAAEKAQQEEQKKYNTTLEEATKYIRSQLPERERKDIELNEQLERYKKALADTADKQSEQAKKLQNAIDAVEANIVANNQSEWIQTKINKEREKFIQDEKERQERLKALQTADAGGDKIYGEMLKETQKSMLGEWNQYFETKKTGIEEFEDGAKKLVEAAVKAGKTPEQISDAFDRYADNFLKQQEKEKEQKQQSEQTASAATRYSAEAMKIVAQTSKPEITAIDKGSQKIVNSVNKLQTSIAGVKTAIINNKTVIESTI
jgi:hypothetical protein